MQSMEGEDRVSRRLNKLTELEVRAVMEEAARQFMNRDDDESAIQDFIENALDMLAQSDYVVHEGRLVNTMWLSGEEVK